MVREYYVLNVNVVIYVMLLSCAGSDVVVQIVDARNPLLFRCEDLEAYVNEVSKCKTNVILINKCDFLTHDQRYLLLSFCLCCCEYHGKVKD